MGKYKPRSINVSVLGDGCYLALEKDGDPIVVPSPSCFKNFHEWSLNLDDTELEAALQIYWDQWNFQSGEEYDKMAFEALEIERNRRSLPNSTFAPGIFQ